MEISVKLRQAMKKISFKHILTLLAFSSVLLCSCEKNGTLPPSSYQPAIRATIGTKYWFSGSTSCSVDSGRGTGEIFISGTNFDSSTVIIDAPLFIVPGFYNLNQSSQYAVYYARNTSHFAQVFGSAFITGNSNNTIAGTFNGNILNKSGGDSIKVTSGSFNIKYK